MELSAGNGGDTGETKRVEVRVAQSLLDRWVTRHTPETRRRPCRDRRRELGDTVTPQFPEAVATGAPLAPKVHSQPAADMCIERGEHLRGLAEAEVPTPADEVSS